MRAIEKRLRERVKELEADVRELEDDRRLFREHFITRFKWWIELIGSGKSPNLSWLIESDAKYLRQFKFWVW